MSFGPDLAKVVLNMLEQDFRFALSHYAHFSLIRISKQLVSCGTTVLFAVFESFLLSRPLEWLTN